MAWILESERLRFREIEEGDATKLCVFLQDAAVMYAWGHAFSDAEVDAWIAENRKRYAAEGFSYFAAIHKDTGEMVGAIGPLIEHIDGIDHFGVAYILKKKYWNCGYAIEGAQACMAYAFEVLRAERVIAEIRPENLASRKVAERLGMRVEGEFVKYYKGEAMVHLIYACAAQIEK